ncbi:MAG: hypothetical protein A2289_23930 [Deltaproteobacteria bacterium RIFOXYA12_FULL_58_15]|nr:MAG: hypothetical protein A2289_23930 [Deltaproteobacteria bacterium RIFOXYA12_FULL_58_15]
MRVCDKHDSVDAIEDKLAGGVVEHLTWDGVELQPDFEVSNAVSGQRQKIEENRSVNVGGEGDQLGSLMLGNSRVDRLQ